MDIQCTRHQVHGCDYQVGRCNALWDLFSYGAIFLSQARGALRVDVANAVRRLWKVDGDGRIPAWAPGTTGFLGNCLSEDDELCGI
jgi:hypothetical protein